MTAITNSVGTQAANEVHDVALVQLMLAKVASPRGSSYFQHGYTQKFGPDTGLAISAFQTDQGLTGAKAAGERPGWSLRRARLGRRSAKPFPRQPVN